MMMKSGLGKIFLKFLHALTMSFVLLNFDHPYSILTRDTRVEFVIYCVLRKKCFKITIVMLMLRANYYTTERVKSFSVVMGFFSWKDHKFFEVKFC